MPDNQIWDQNLLAGKAEKYDGFGFSVAVGDYDGDKVDDLVVGVPFDSIGNTENAGVVNVIYGEKDKGLTKEDNRTWHQDYISWLEEADTGDKFGYSLAAGDFNGDSRDDLVVGVPGENLFRSYVYGDDYDVGAVNVIYGGRKGLGSHSELKSLFISQNTSYYYGDLENDIDDHDKFGWVLAVGKFNDDEFDDLVVGVPGEDQDPTLGSTVEDVGMVHVIFGTSNGLNNYNSIRPVDLYGTKQEEGDEFGASLAVGDFDGDQLDDLVVGVPGEDHNGVKDAGEVNVFYQEKYHGIENYAKADSTIRQGEGNVGEKPGKGDRFGEVMAVADFNNDGKDDLAVGVPSDNRAKIKGAGLVHVIYGSDEGLESTNETQFLDALTS